MTEEKQAAEDRKNDKEYNFRRLEAKLEKEKQEILKQNQELKQQLDELKNNYTSKEEEDDDDPYIDKKKLEKWDQKKKKEYKSEMQLTVQQALEKERQEMWMKEHKDFYDVMQHADRFAELDPELADTILKMPESFERQKLVYKNIKILGLDKPKEDKETQAKVNDPRKSYYYSPTGVSPSAGAGPASYTNQERQEAYEKMLQLKESLRI